MRGWTRLMGVLCAGYSILVFSADNIDRNLKAGGRIVVKQESQSIGKGCLADRKWIEVRGLPSPGAERSINSFIRKTITVGKKLKPGDCRGATPEDTTEYINSARVSGARSAALGVGVWIHFASNHHSGSHHLRCYVFSLLSGKRFDLGTMITESGKALVAKRYVSTFGSAEGESYREIASKQYDGFSYCLTDKGISVGGGTGNGTHSEDIFELSQSEIAGAFAVPGDLRLSD